MLKQLFSDKRSIYNPFVYVAGETALIAGLLIMVLTAWLGYLNNTWQDGILDMHYGPEGSFPTHLLMTLGNWLSAVIILAPLAFILTGSKIRLVDIAGTLALARFPMLIAVLTSFSEAPKVFSNYLLYQYLEKGEPVNISNLQIIVAVLILILVLLMIVWMVVLMYNAYKFSANIKGNKAGISFTIGFLAAYIISKVISVVIFNNNQIFNITLIT